MEEEKKKKRKKKRMREHVIAWVGRIVLKLNVFHWPAASLQIMVLFRHLFQSSFSTHPFHLSQNFLQQEKLCVVSVQHQLSPVTDTGTKDGVRGGMMVQSPACLSWPQTLSLQIPFGQASRLGLFKCREVSHGLVAMRYPRCCLLSSWYQAMKSSCYGPIPR